MRLLIAGIIGAIVFFIWGMLAHAVLPIGQMGIHVASEQEQDAAIAALQASTSKGEGVYVLPGIAPEKMSDTAALAAFQEKNTRQARPHS